MLGCRGAVTFREARAAVVALIRGWLGMAYLDLQEDLERLFGRRVDLVAKDGLHRVIRDQVLADAQVLYAA